MEYFINYNEFIQSCITIKNLVLKNYLVSGKCWEKFRMQYYVYIIPILICIYLFLGKKDLRIFINCISYLLLHDKLLPNLAASKNMHLLFHHFYESGIQGQLG